MKPVNLNQARKARAKQMSRTTADENAVRFGRTKAQKTQAKSDQDRARRSVDQHKLEP